jgi:hypothetical protein
MGFVATTSRILVQHSAKLEAAYGEEPNLGQFTTASQPIHADLQTWLKEKGNTVTNP